MQKRILLYQAITILILTGVGLFFEITTALMMFIGSTTSTAGNGLFAIWIFGQNTALDPNIMLTRFYLAELLKVVVVIAALTITLVLIEEAEPITLLGAYFVTQFFPTVLGTLQDKGTS
jgi:ATP synthase protein I